MERASPTHEALTVCINAPDAALVQETAGMFWIGLSITLFAAAVVLAIGFAKRPASDLGSVSAHWIAAHRGDTP
jgi:hypothetical protein